MVRTENNASKKGMCAHKLINKLFVNYSPLSFYFLAINEKNIALNIALTEMDKIMKICMSCAIY